MGVELALYEQLVEATGTGAFGDTLLDVADKVAGASEVYAYWLDHEDTPFTVASSGRTGSARSRATAYASRFHEMDPALAITRQSGEGIRMARISASEVHHSGYRHVCYEHPGLTEKISYACSRDRRAFVINFYRGRSSAQSCISGLSALAEITLPLLRKHVDMMGDESHLALPARVEKRIGRSFPLLSQRERQVCARTMIGMTAEAISIDLSIRATTVLTYRRRAYERYSLSSSQEMMGRILS